MTITRMTMNRLDEAMIRIATGNRINSASDDAAGLAISEHIGARVRSLAQATDNVHDMQNLTAVAEGGLSSITDNLQRIRELALQASNSIFTERDRGHIQLEIDQRMDQIDQVAQNTQFNRQNLLDGSFVNQHTAADADAAGPALTIRNMSADILLGIGQPPFDVTDGNIDLERIDNALALVNAERAYLGAMSNRFDYTIASNQIANLNQAAARSRIADADMALAAMQRDRERVIMQYQLLAQRQERDQEENRLPLIARIAS